MSEKREAELRRLQDRLLDRITTAEDQAERAVAGCERLRAQRDALLEALRWIGNVNAMDYEYQAKARAAIKAVEEEEGWVATVREAQKHFDAELKRYEGEKE